MTIIHAKGVEESFFRHILANCLNASLLPLNGLSKNKNIKKGSYRERI